ncbi:endonuclease/exonuclease/phosphatase family protein [Dactylosporangium sp. NPDC049525]|uniref:endonuclease/exonuclease/phosphatase family protein n=1 Tax=Dactylosporangium sp. NPDC049525 TaxID=3154730 RepID=UPI003433598C
MTWNLWWRFGDWRARHEAILATLRAERPDVCGLQEVWAVRDGEHQAELLARELGMHWAYSPSPMPGRWHSRIGDTSVDVGNAVLSRWPIAATAVGDLGGEGRTVLHARIDAPDGPIPVFTTHLDSNPDGSAARCAQVERLMPFIAAHRVGDHPPVLTGDFNAEPESDELRRAAGHLTAPVVPGLMLVDAWRFHDGADPGWTWDRRNPYVREYWAPSSRIDYVLVGLPGSVSGRGRVERVHLAGTEPHDGVWPSDHFAVVADLR